MVGSITSAEGAAYLVMQAYGSADILYECAFALLTLSRQYRSETPPPFNIILYTDNTRFFESFRQCTLHISYREMNAETIKQWRGAINFVHRVKIEVLRDVMRNHRGKIIYLDTDMYCAGAIETIFQRIDEGKRYMHVMEGSVHGSDNRVFQKLSRWLRKNEVVVGGKTLNIPPDVKMWNAGMLGLHSRDADLLDEVCQFTDTVYQRYPKHVVEQFAFSYFLQQRGPLLTAHNYFYHYWNLKELRPVLASFFSYFSDKEWPELARLSQLIQLPDYLQQKANYYYNRSTGAKLMKKKWLAPVPEWELLAKQL